MDRDQVKELQRKLNDLGARPQLEVDGIFGGASRRATIAFQSTTGLVPDGVPGPKTMAMIAERLPKPTAKPSGNRVRVILVRGKLGDAPFGFSLGMDSLARRLNKIDGVSATVDNYGLFYSMTDDIQIALEGALASGYAHVCCIGHSMGADTAAKVAWLMYANRKRMALCMPVDPTPFGCPTIPGSVDLAIGYHNTRLFQLGGHVIQRDATFRGRFEEYPLEVVHVLTDDDPRVHDRAVRAISEIRAAA